MSLRTRGGENELVEALEPENYFILLIPFVNNCTL